MLLELSKDSVPEMQDDFQGADELLKTIVMAGSLEVLLLVLTCTFMLLDKATSMYLWSSSFFVYYFANVLESLYAEHRLYMQTSEI